MSILSKVNPEWPLRIGFALMFFYSGRDLMMHPKGWYWAVSPLPQALQQLIRSIGVDQYLKYQGLFEIVLGVLLLTWFLPRRVFKLISLIVILEMLFILVFVGIRIDTFRDIGLLGGSVALLILAFKDARNELRGYAN